MTTSRNASALSRSAFRIGNGDAERANFVGVYRQNPRTKEITISQQTFAEKLRPAHIPKGAKDDTPLTPGQIRMLRAVNGSLNWLASQTRPDLSVQTSLSQQAFPNSCVRHLRDANNAIRRAKQHKELAIKFSRISPQSLCIFCHSDAANRGPHTQAGYILGFVDKIIHQGSGIILDTHHVDGSRYRRMGQSFSVRSSRGQVQSQGM